MKTWISKIFGKEQKPLPAAVEGRAVTPKVGAEQTIPADAGRTVLASAQSDPVAIHRAEAQVATEWKVGDVILDLYDVKHVHEGGGMGLVYRVHHRGWNADLAVKSPRRDYFKTEAQKENFTRECETWISRDGKFKAWDTNTGKCLWEQSCEQGESLRAAPDGRGLICTKAGLLWKYEQGETWKSQQLVANGQGKVEELCLDFDCKFAFGRTTRGRLGFWVLESGECACILGRRSRHGNQAVAVSGRARIALCQTALGLEVWDASAEGTTEVLKGSKGASCAIISPEGKFALAVLPSGQVRLWGLFAKSVGVDLRHHGIRVTAQTFGADGLSFVLGSDEGLVCMGTLGSANPACPPFVLAQHLLHDDFNTT